MATYVIHHHKPKETALGKHILVYETPNWSLACHYMAGEVLRLEEQGYDLTTSSAYIREMPERNAYGYSFNVMGFAPENQPALYAVAAFADSVLECEKILSQEEQTWEVSVTGKGR